MPTLTITHTCDRQLVMGVVDPYGSECDLPRGHEGRHEGVDPFGGNGKVSWIGGGSCAGDRLPARHVRFTD